MNVLTYHSAKKQIIFMALYFVITGIVIRLIGYSLQGSLSAFTQAGIGNLLSGNLSLGDMFHFDFSFDTSQFDGFSFNMWIVFIKDKIHSIINDLLPTTLGAINMLMMGKYLTVERAIKLGIRLY
ncbi:hypothetical protein P9W99_16825 [Bacillus cereus]|uniref:Uncharacterized protein n=2 Tax=Bacillus cereus group TaxID=86661 RepID=A0A9W5VEH6_BACCE|nr:MULTISPECIES: hypothetical protein [Bacillus]AIE37044.1 hypothetical protein BTK_33596 [Bacillus thuringiensis serovar kurstaki str. HD-1]AJK38500.1 hypothetical protein BG08_6804 [Bacillus thuringiensis serovar kurstaki]AKJ62954.1 hypothetical protein XI92_32965 [Bacillus thuringiensis]ALL62444.1 hypothetical protein AQ980_31920 [Bacillus thuringiensis]AMX80639.1 hypothetical protein BtBc_30025 [Bacillus thuringiensis]